MSDRTDVEVLNLDINSAYEFINCMSKQRQIDDILSQLKHLQNEIEIVKRDVCYYHEMEFELERTGGLAQSANESRHQYSQGKEVLCQPIIQFKKVSK
jgi:hypothetical protein